MIHGEYMVVGKRKYRGHDSGQRFVARLDRNAERRAIIRGDIVLLQRITPALEPESFTFPEGWLPTQPHTSIPQSAERRSSRRREQ